MRSISLDGSLSLGGFSVGLRSGQGQQQRVAARGWICRREVTGTVRLHSSFSMPRRAVLRTVLLNDNESERIRSWRGRQQAARGGRNSRFLP